jgi:hypothetical protein
MAIKNRQSVRRAEEVGRMGFLRSKVGALPGTAYNVVLGLPASAEVAG